MGGTLTGLTRFCTFLMLFVIVGEGFSQEATADTAKPKRVGAITETAPGLRTLVSIDAEDAYLPSVLSILAAKSGFNIVTGPGVSKEERITIHLKDVPIEEAMNLVVRAAGLSYDLVGNSFLVARAEKLREQVGLNSYVISLQYANASEVAELLQDFNAKIQVDKSGNKLLVITTPQIITSIERVVANIDRPSLQISLSARMIEVQVEDEERLGINWSKLSTATSMFLFEGNVTPEVTTAGTQTRLQPFEPLDDINKIGHFQRSMPIWEVALDWLLKNSQAEVLANTKVSTMNARTAMIELVDVVPYVTSAGGVGGQVAVQREEVGTKLFITPQVNAEGWITMTIKPEVSSIFEFIGPDQTIPRVIRRSSDMTVRVKNHQSVVIGGLMGITAHRTAHKVPFLGDIPYIGGLFRYNVEVMKKTDLIIEVTPHIIEEDLKTYIGKSTEIRKTEKRYQRDYNIEEDQPLPEEAPPQE